MNARCLRTLVCAALLIGGVLTGPARADSRIESGDQPGANAVVSLIDTGINPYHVTFRDESPRAYKYPGTYIPDYPKGAKALRLTLDAPSLAAALRADCDRVWKKVKPGQLYWFPGTKIIGAITFQTPSGDPCSLSGGGYIIDSNGHGTMTASRAASTEYGACKECRVVSIQFSASALETKDALDSIKWAADNASWIDAQSNSWGPFTPLWDPTGSTMLTAGPELVRTVEATARKHLAFWASGNGALGRGGGLGHPTLLDPHLTPSAIMVGGEDSGYVNLWPGFPPHVVSDSCDDWGAHFDSIDKSDEKVGSGTSSATPFAAGGAVYELLKAREILGDTSTGVHDGVVAQGPSGLVPKGPLADGKLTLDEWKRLVFVSATRRPEVQKEDGPPCDLVDGTGLYSATPIKWKDVPDDYPEYLNIGYGAVDDPAMQLATEILQGKADPPDRSATDEYFGYDQQIRRQTYEVWSKP